MPMYGLIAGFLFLPGGEVKYAKRATKKHVDISFC